VLVGAEVLSRHGRDLGFFEQIVGEVARRAEFLPARVLAQQAADIRKDVKRALGFATSDAVDGIESLNDHVPSLFKLAHHRPYGILRAAHGFQSRGLGDGGCIRLWILLAPAMTSLGPSA
jgi:hypothetical protein